jgi:trans-aconitate methyltransferase
MGEVALIWDERYRAGGNSGYGSYGPQLVDKLTYITQTVKNIESIVDVGCGDFNFGRNLMGFYPNTTYLGLDISKVVIDQNKSRYLGYNFQLMEVAGDIPSADLVLCMDVLFHLTEEDKKQEVLEKLKNAWKKYLVLTAINFDQSFGNLVLKHLIEGDEETGAYIYIFKR